MNRRFLVVGNWKCNGSLEIIADLCSAWKGSTSDGAKYFGKNIQVVIAVPAPYATITKPLLPRNFDIGLQNCHASKGSYTGEVAAEMLVDLSIPWVILGHVDRRINFHENDELIGKKIESAMSVGLCVIAVVGENLEDRKRGRTLDVVERQVAAIAMNVTNWTNVVIAYDPVWASGSSKGATAKEAQKVHERIRIWIAENIGNDAATSVRIIYGGSVNALNAKELASQPDLDGFLVGRSSLKADFIEILDAYEVSYTA